MNTKSFYENNSEYYDTEEGCIIIPPVLLDTGLWATYRGSFGWFESDDKQKVSNAYNDYCQWLSYMDTN